ncbi:uncharacterized protein DDB_G0281497 [Amborella trichopoda]|uniref:uncharacterized protein DDB_G0281497 n=1 Tax=Amborella trichopoda TaxID=13333 RepID=UPI0005D44A29|nr:uncharacterized protein DDB_G0281497 [Amborella trichopoda]|eukprot:XP_006859070.2 uncharacterized protein DDB_G0281497 [Amborella trichopoda]
MRYQRVSPDCLHLSNGRKPSLRICKEDDIEGSNGNNGKIQTYNHNPLNGFPRIRTTPSSTSQDHNYAPSVSETPQTENNHDNNNNNNNVGKTHALENNMGGDIILQWGQNKRSRGFRSENRVLGDESSTQARQAVKIPRRVVGPEKLQSHGAHQTQVNSYSRNTNLRPCTPVREPPTGSIIYRNLEEQSGSGHPKGINVFQSGTSNNSGGRFLQRVGDNNKRSPEKPDKAGVASCPPPSTTMNNNNSNHYNSSSPKNNNNNDHHQEITVAEHEPCVAFEKLNLELFEWPKIYISLSRKEKEDDFLAIKGTKLPQRPKKRAKNVDKTLQYCFPGMWLSELGRGRYEVREKKCVKKRRRGLKGLESMESDSE